jgi:subtilisin-like proprotein convertase family protein
MRFFVLSTFIIISFTFKIRAQTFYGNNGLILDNQTLTKNLSVSGLPNNINQVSFGLEQICLNINHTYDADLTIKLIAPDGTIIKLIDNNGGSGNNFSNTCLRSDVSTSIASGSAPFSGIYKPIEQIGLINNGQNPNGTWQLEVRDNSTNDQGTLNNWTLTFGTNPATATTFSSSNLPLVIINTPNNQNIPDEPKLQASMKIIDNGLGNINHLTDFPNAYNKLIGIEQRGSSSGGFPQKSYGFETRNTDGSILDTIILGMPIEHDWILYAPYNDKTCLRNNITYDLSSKMGHYAAKSKICELVVNGQYQGIYYLMEKIKRDQNRVDIAKLLPTDNSGDELTGGYIFKIDKTTGNSNIAWTSNYPAADGSPINFQHHYPTYDVITPQQNVYIHSYVDSFENALNGPNYTDPLIGYRKYIKHKSFIDFMLLNEISKNVDGYRLSSFLHKEKNSNGGELRMGPVWDFNLAWWNADYCNGNLSTGWAYEFGNVCTGGFQVPTWWEIFMSDPWFQEEVKCRWTSLRQGVLSRDSLFHFIDSVALYIDEAKDRHFEKWPILGTYTWPNPSPIPADFAGEITALKQWIDDRTAWMDQNLPGICHLSLAENTVFNNLSLYPNPVEESFTIELFASNPSELSLKICALNGAENATLSGIPLVYGSNKVHVDLADYNLPAGVYFVTLVSNQETKQLKFIHY